MQFALLYMDKSTLGSNGETDQTVWIERIKRYKYGSNGPKYMFEWLNR